MRTTLASGTEPFEPYPADENTDKRWEGEVEVGASLVADGEATEAGEPSPRAFDDPALAAEVLAALDAPSSVPGRDAAGATPALAATMSEPFWRELRWVCATGSHAGQWARSAPH